MPVIIQSGLLQVVSTIIVPLSFGALVFLILIGIPSFLTGKIADSCSTEAPIYDSSRSSLYVIIVIGLGLSTILGSAAKNPDTSVQFSYTSAFNALATIEPVTSEPPLEKVFISPFGSAP